MDNRGKERTEGNIDELVLGVSGLSLDARRVLGQLFFADNTPLSVKGLQGSLTPDLTVEKEEINVRRGVQELREKGFVPKRGVKEVIGEVFFRKQTQIQLTPDAQSASQILFQAS